MLFPYIILLSFAGFLIRVDRSAPQATKLDVIPNPIWAAINHPKTKLLPVVCDLLLSQLPQLINSSCFMKTQANAATSKLCEQIVFAARPSSTLWATILRMCAVADSEFPLNDALPALTRLLEAGANPNLVGLASSDSLYASPLTLACAGIQNRENQLQVVKLLLKHGAWPNGEFVLTHGTRTFT